MLGVKRIKHYTDNQSVEKVNEIIKSYVDLSLNSKKELSSSSVVSSVATFLPSPLYYLFPFCSQIQDNVVLLKTQNNKGAFILKTNRNRKEINNGHEVNRLRNIIPNLVYTLHDWEENEKFNFFIEYINYFEHVDKITDINEFAEVFLQIVLTVELLDEKLGLYHSDLHSHNCLVRKLKEPYTIMYPLNNQTIVVTITNLAVIIDYGSMTIKNPKNTRTLERGLKRILSQTKEKIRVTKLFKQLSKVSGDESLEQFLSLLSEYVPFERHQRSPFVLRNLKPLNPPTLRATSQSISECYSKCLILIDNLRNGNENKREVKDTLSLCQCVFLLRNMFEDFKSRGGKIESSAKDVCLRLQKLVKHLVLGKRLTRNVWLSKLLDKVKEFPD